jgi:vancomycin permeability regulator SanA
MRPRRLLILGGMLLVLLVSGPWIWTTAAAHGHIYDAAEAPATDVVIVLGTTVGAGGQPGDRLAGRLQTAADLMKAGRARVALVSGDGGGQSGDEPAAMSSYLAGQLGVSAARVVTDPDGLDTYDSCIRARDVFGVRRALVVTQAYHLARAVTLCRSLGLEVDGVRAKCDGCGRGLLAEKAVRDYFASGKAAWDAVRKRPPAVTSPPSLAIQDALSKT